MGQQREAKLVNEWLMTFHPSALQWKRVRLGPLPSGEMARMYMVTQRWADAIFIEAATVFILEATMRPDVGAIAQLELYAKLFRETPEFRQYSGSPIKLILLTTSEDSKVREMCDERRVEYVVFCPQWAIEYINKIRGVK